MGFRFRKSFNLGGGFRINLGKKGPGVSFGVKGLRIGAGPNGTKVTASIPGTGVSYEQKLGGKRRSSSSPTDEMRYEQEQSQTVYNELEPQQRMGCVGLFLGCLFFMIASFIGFLALVWFISYSQDRLTRQLVAGVILLIISAWMFRKSSFLRLLFKK
jgi:hypothetical protein